VLPRLSCIVLTMPPAQERQEALDRLRKARNFLDMAEIASGDPEYSDPIVSLCVTSAIASADAVIVVRGVQRSGSLRHDDAPRELRSLKMDAMAARLVRLLGLKNKAQYATGGTCTPADAIAALASAAKMLELAQAECDRRMNR
jgi:hypothetical protein